MSEPGPFPPPAASAPPSRRLREEREADWRRLEGLLARMEKGSFARLTEAEVIALPGLYRSAVSSLATARAVSLDAALTGYLESLCLRAYFIVYGVRTRPMEAVARFFAAGWPRAVRALGAETLVAAAVGLFGAVAAFLLVRSDPSWFSAFVEGALAQGRGPDASTAELRAGLYGGDGGAGTGGLAVFGAALFTHNAQIALFAFALGFALGLPTAFLVLANGATLGAFLALYAGRGLGWPLAGWLMVHGTTELFAITLAAAAGLRLGRALAFPGALTRLESVRAAGRAAAPVAAGVVVMLMAAGALEGVARQLIRGDLSRGLVAAGVLTLWLAYFYGPAGRKGPR